MTGYLTMNTKDWVKFPWIPLSDSAAELVSFNRKLSETVRDVFLAVEEYSERWVPAWEKPAYRHLISITRSMPPAQVQAFRDRIDNADTSRKMLEEAMGRINILDHGVGEGGEFIFTW